MDMNNNLVNINLKVKCDLCEKSFFGEFLSKHLRVSHPGIERPKKKKSWEIKLQTKKNDKTQFLKFFCKFCSKGFALKGDMKKHKRYVHLSKKNRNYKAVEKLIWKKLKPIENGRVHCSDCSKTLSCNKSARSHFRKWHMAKNDGSKFVCKLCNEEFTTKYVLMNHLQEIHGRTKIPKQIIYEKLKPLEDGHMECLDCKKTLFSKETSREHYKNVHMAKETFKCKVCLKHFRYEGSAKTHYMKFHMAKKDGTKFICKLCNKRFTMKYSLKIHLLELHGRAQIPKGILSEKLKPIENGRMECLDCNKIFSTKETAREHYKKWHMPKKDGSKFVCNFCNEEFTSKYSLKNHLQELHGRTQKTLIPKEIICEKLKTMETGHMECLDCKKIFSSEEIARIHYKRFHLDKRFICAVCSMGYDAEYCMKKHMKAAHMLPRLAKNGSNKKYEWKIVKLNEDGRINCLDCYKTFSSLKTAKSHHIHVHMTNQNDRKFICIVCNKDFAVKQYMKTHMKEMHLTKEIFKCEVCLKLCRYKRSLDSHMRNCHGVHYRLNCLVCNKTFSNTDGLISHMRNCHEVHTRLNCRECNKTFKKSSLHQHMKEQHMSNKNFSCQVCGKHFGLERSLKPHMRVCKGANSLIKFPNEKYSSKDNGISVQSE